MTAALKKDRRRSVRILWPDFAARDLYDRLAAIWGERALVPKGEPIQELIATILSQRTTYRNQRAAHEAMWEAFGSWEGVAQAPTEALERAISATTYPEIKAPVIQGVLRAIWEERGSLDLSFLAKMEVEQAYRWLTRFKGVGEKTASFLLLFAFGRPILPVDTHVHRVSTRYGVLPAKMSVKRAHTALNGALPVHARVLYNFHKNAFNHGRTICTWRAPSCARCALRGGCRDFALRQRAPHPGEEG